MHAHQGTAHTREKFDRVMGGSKVFESHCMRYAWIYNTERNNISNYFSGVVQEL
jgi:hypothetical protein